VWGDPWLPTVDNPYVVTPEPVYLNCPTVSSLLCPISNNWDYELLRDILCQRDIDLILSLPAPCVRIHDSIYWGGEDKGIYTVKSAYKIATGIICTGYERSWAKMWKLNLPPKVKCFFWSLCAMYLPTKDALLLKRVNCEQLCLFCGLANENATHTFAIVLFRVIVGGS